MQGQSPKGTREGLIALVVRYVNGEPVLLEALSDLREISMLESALQEGTDNPLRPIYETREVREREDEEFGDYVEELLCQPFLRPEIQEQAVQWFKSKIKIEEFQRSEREATEIIATYAYGLFREDSHKRDFTLAGANAAVRVRIIEVPVGVERAAA